MEPQTPQIVATPITEEERLRVDFPQEGEHLTSLLGDPTHEVVVYDKDENGEVVGWHKEHVNG